MPAATRQQANLNMVFTLFPNRLGLHDGTQQLRPPSITTLAHASRFRGVGRHAQRHAPGASGGRTGWSEQAFEVGMRRGSCGQQRVDAGVLPEKPEVGCRQYSRGAAVIGHQVACRFVGILDVIVTGVMMVVSFLLPVHDRMRHVGEVVARRGKQRECHGLESHDKQQEGDRQPSIHAVIIGGCPTPSIFMRGPGSCRPV